MKQFSTKNIVIRAVAVILLLCICSGTILLSLGVVDLPFGDSEEKRRQKELEEYLRGLETGENISDITGAPHGTSSGGSATDPSSPGTSASDQPSDSTSGNDRPAIDPDLSFYDLLAAGYKVSYAPYTSAFIVAELNLGIEGLENYDNGNKKTVEVRYPLIYSDGYRPFERFRTEEITRKTVEVYMGFIIVDTGIGNAVAIDLPLPETTVPPETPEVPETSAVTTAEGEVTDIPEETVSPLPERVVYQNVPTVTVFNSCGNLMGTYPAADVVPAYTRDTQDRAMFIKDGKYYYINEETGIFELSDYDPDSDGRGLYFDYNRDFGKSDTNLKIYKTLQEITQTYEMDSTSYYTRYGVDYMIARELYEAYPTFAELVAIEYSPGTYYNRSFRDALARAKADIKEEARHPKTTAAPDTTAVPETTAVPGTTAISETTSAPVTTIPDVTETTVPAVTTATAEDITSSAANAETTAVPEAPSDPTSAVTSELFEPVPQPSDPGSTPDAPEASIAVPDDTSSAETSDVTAGTTAPADISTPSDVTSVPVTTGAESVTPAESSSGTVPGTTPASTPAVTTVPEVTTASGLPASLVVSRYFTAYRFAYGKTAPAVNEKQTTAVRTNYTSYIIQTMSWATSYKYAHAYNFREGRAITVDDNGILRIINTSGGSAVYLNRSYKADYDRGGQYTTEFYTLPFDRDIYQLGYYYYDHGYTRVLRCERLSYNINVYTANDELLVDASGNAYHVPDGYDLISYSEGILLLKRDGRYGYYHVDGYWVAQPVFTYAMPFVEGLGVIGFEDGIKGVIDTSGNVVIPFAYDEIEGISSGVILCYSEEDGWKIFAKLAK